MKIIITLLALVAFYSNAEIRADFGTGLAKQIYTGKQPNDQVTPFADLNISIDAESDYNGIRIALGYEFKCTGDEFPNKESEVFSTSNKELSFEFSAVKPLFYDQWPTAIIDTRNCYLTWSASAIGTTTSTGAAIGYQISGAFSTIMLNFTSNTTAPEYRRAKSANSIFTMYKTPEC